ncbi:zinc ABC transporter substrate-binding protein ZnuA [Maritalea sp.]|uniref:zinc ABC transporter substrate-binding protein ZnuA n=1 Tax=Maritalea sp. TaxID=2003361 RepID=UPI003EF64AF4
MRFVPLALCAAALSFAPQLAAAERLQIVTSIRPIHSLVEYISGGHADTHVLVPANASPHNYALKPSDAQKLQNADLIFWVDEHFETFLEKALETIPKSALTLALAEQPGINVLDARDVGLLPEEKDHEEGEHHEEHGEHDGHDDHDAHGHDHGDHDLHIWLDPENAKAMARVIAHALSVHDVEHSKQYLHNAAKLVDELDELIEQTEAKLADFGDHKFVTFHDAYQYFENRFGLKNAGVVTINPEIKPGAKRLLTLKNALAAYDIKCVFSEPQFDARLVQLAIEGTDVRSAELDPLGANLETGPKLYFELINQIRTNMTDCLAD